MAEIHEMTRAKLAINMGLVFAASALLVVAALLAASGALLLAVLCVAGSASITGMLMTAPWNRPSPEDRNS